MADTAWQSAWVEVLPDFSEFRQKSVPQITKHLSDAGNAGARSFGASFSDTFRGSFLGNLTANLTSRLISSVGSAVTAGLRAGFDFVQESITIASDLNESINAVTVSYTDAAQSVLALGENSAQTFGLSKRELNGFATQFSAFVKTIAGPGGDAASALRELIGRGSDFASVYNLEVAEALQVFQSGLAGETEPLRRFGLDLSATAVANYALANGIAASSAEMTEAQKVQARYGLLLQQTQQVSGDFANTSGELANKNRINAATWDDLSARIGEGFLPIASALSTVLADDVFPVLSEMVDEHGPELATAFAEAVPALKEMAADVLPQLPGLFRSVADTLPSLIGFVNALAPGVIWLTQAYGGWFTAAERLFSLLGGDTTVEGFRVQLTTIPGPMGDVARAADHLGTQIGLAMLSGIRAVQDFGAQVYTTTQSVLGWFGALPARISGFFSGAGDWLYNSGRAVIQGFIDGVNAMFKPVGDAVSGVLDWAMGFFPNSPAERGPLSGSGWNDLAKSGEAVLTQFASGFNAPVLEPTLAPVLGSVAPAVRTSMAAAGGFSLDGARIGGTLEIGGDGLGRIIDGRIYEKDARDERELARKGTYR